VKKKNVLTELQKCRHKLGLRVVVVVELLEQELDQAQLDRLGMRIKFAGRLNPELFIQMLRKWKETPEPECDCSIGTRWENHSAET
jgi:hypothetical protein